MSWRKYRKVQHVFSTSRKINKKNDKSYDEIFSSLH